VPSRPDRRCLTGWALVVVVVGSMIGEFFGIRDRLGTVWFWLGHQGSEYLDLGRGFQLLLATGLALWLLLMFRALRPAIESEGKSHLSSLFLYAAVCGSLEFRRHERTGSA
jgi:nitric oxide reductase subunit B